jgi:hypothetical protein
MVGLDALHTFKRVVAWFPGPVEIRSGTISDSVGWIPATGECMSAKVKSDGVHLVLSIDSLSVTALKVMGW